MQGNWWLIFDEFSTKKTASSTRLSSADHNSGPFKKASSNAPSAITIISTRYLFFSWADGVHVNEPAGCPVATMSLLSKKKRWTVLDCDDLRTKSTPLFLLLFRAISVSPAFTTCSSVTFMSHKTAIQTHTEICLFFFSALQFICSTVKRRAIHSAGTRKPRFLSAVAFFRSYTIITRHNISELLMAAVKMETGFTSPFPGPRSYILGQKDIRPYLAGDPSRLPFPATSISLHISCDR